LHTLVSKQLHRPSKEEGKALKNLHIFQVFNAKSEIYLKHTVQFPKNCKNEPSKSNLPNMNRSFSTYNYLLSLSPSPSLTLNKAHLLSIPPAAINSPDGLRAQELTHVVGKTIVSTRLSCPASQTT
jgi:hypothetical protein